MYDFSSYLLADEKILYQGCPVPGKGSKGIFGLIFIICFMVGIQILMIWSVATGISAEGIGFGFIGIFLVTIFFIVLCVYALFYNLVLKKKHVADDFYCLTNMRAIKYQEKNNKLIFGYLAYYDDIHCANVKDNFGDVYMGSSMEEENIEDPQSAYQTLGNIKDMMTNLDPEDMPYIIFDSIEKSYEVMNLAKEAKQKLLQKSE